MRLDLVRQHPAEHQRTGDVSPDLVDGLDLQAGSDQRLGQGTTVKIIGSAAYSRSQLSGALIARVPTATG